VQRIAIYPGSFDPMSLGHVDIIARGLHVFDHIIVAIAINLGKTPTFSSEERVAMIRACFVNEARVSVMSFQGLLVDFAQQQGAVGILRGLRAVSDFEYEFQMAAVNRRLNAALETVFLTARDTHTYISSTLIREVAAMGGDVSEFVPCTVLPFIQQKYS